MVVVGGGAAGSAAAWSAAREKKSVLVLEESAVVGDTTAKSGGVMWIPNNHHMRAAGIVDDRADAIRYMARCSYPLDYRADTEDLGIGTHRFEMLSTFLDHAAQLVERAEAEDVVRLAPLDYPDYQGHLDEDKAPLGRSLKIAYPRHWQRTRDAWGERGLSSDCWEPRRTSAREYSLIIRSIESCRTKLAMPWGLRCVPVVACT